MTTRENIITRLLEMGTAIAAAETTVIDLDQVRQEAAASLQRMEDDLLLNSTLIDGKNAETRAAQLRNLTQDTRGYVQRLELQKAAAAVEVRRLNNEFASLRSIARLLQVTE